MKWALDFCDGFLTACLVGVGVLVVCVVIVPYTLQAIALIADMR